jgi:hypothetical protein
MFRGAYFMADHTELPAKRPLWKMAAWLILVLLILGFSAWQLSRKPDMQSHYYFVSILQELKDHLLTFFFRDGRGMDENYVVTNEEEFVFALKEALYKTTPNGKNMTEYFNTGVFKILIQDNVCYIHTNLDNATRYLSRSPLQLRNNIAYYAAYYSQLFYKTAGSFDISRFRGGGYPSVNSFVGKPVVNSYVLFNREMNDLYLITFIFKNNPPLSPGEIP